MNAIAISRFETLIGECAGKNILVVGDLMLDRFIWGNVLRISPEAPVPVVNVYKQELYPGGAANVARNLVPFGKVVHVVGQVGKDPDGDVLLTALEESGIATDGLLRSQSYATITKTRIIAHQQQVVRFDLESIKSISNDQVTDAKRFLVDHSELLDGLIIEDYGKGFVSQELVDAIVPVAREAGLVITVDPNPNNPLKWDGVTSIKPNRSEAYREVGVSESPLGSESDPLRDETLLQVGDALLKRWGTDMVQITLGEKGMMLFERDGASHHIPTVARDVFDVSGAGDTAIALFTLALTAGALPVEAAQISNYAGGVVVGKLGTATVGANELLESIKRTLASESATERLRTKEPE